MKKRFLVFVISLVLTLPVHATSTRAIIASPSITFNGTTAGCVVNTSH